MTYCFLLDRCLRKLEHGCQSRLLPHHAHCRLEDNVQNKSLFSNSQPRKPISWNRPKERWHFLHSSHHKQRSIRAYAEVCAAEACTPHRSNHVWTDLSKAAFGKMGDAAQPSVAFASPSAAAQLCTSSEGIEAFSKGLMASQSSSLPLETRIHNHPS